MGSGLIGPLVRAVRRRRTVEPSADAAIRWDGDYPDFASAVAASADAGYSGAPAIDRYVARYREVSAAPWQYASDNEHMIRYMAVLSAAWPIDGVVRVLDFGGGYGSLYEIARWIYPNPRFDWTIVELPALVARGQEMGASVSKRFVSDIPAGPFSLVIASGSLQYLPDPAATFGRLLSIESAAAFVGRFPLAPFLPRDRLTVQTVPAALFAAKMPCWIFAPAWVERIRGAAQRVIEWDSPGDTIPIDGSIIRSRAYLMIK